jgi:hypothetical protein
LSFVLPTILAPAALFARVEVAASPGSPLGPSALGTLAATPLFFLAFFLVGSEPPAFAPMAPEETGAGRFCGLEFVP